MGKAVKLPMGMAKSTVPKPASLSCKSSFISGIRDAHEAKLIPQRKNNAFVAVRAVFPRCVAEIVVSNIVIRFVKSTF